MATWKDVLIYYFHKNNFLGLFHKQKNQGTDEEQDRVMLDPVKIEDNKLFNMKYFQEYSECPTILCDDTTF